MCLIYNIYTHKKSANNFEDCGPSQTQSTEVENSEYISQSNPKQHVIIPSIRNTFQVKQRLSTLLRGLGWQLNIGAVPTESYGGNNTQEYLEIRTVNQTLVQIVVDVNHK